MSAIASGHTIRLLSRRARPLARQPIRRHHSLYSRSSGIFSEQQRQQTIIHGSDRAILIMVQRSTFSTNSSSTSTDDEISNPVVDLSTVSSAKLKQLAMKYARQDNPAQAQVILERLLLLQGGGGGGSGEEVDVSDVSTSVIDAWIKHQNAHVTKLQESITTHQDSLRVPQGLLEEICHAAESASQVIERMKNPSSHHFVAVLKGWANACEAAHGNDEVGLALTTKTSNLVRGIPQRAQHILLNLQPDPTVESYNQVLKAWAYSGEHLRGTMAEQVFQKIKDPNGESFKFIIRAWCWSKERRCAFTATGHYMRMMRLLEISRADMEPTMEDYHILFRAWTTAE
jgi:hypothetical protein